MKVKYDTYYQSENLFGEPYPELIAFYSEIKNKGNLLDLGCGQGRDSIPLAKLGFNVTGIDNSKVGIEQLNRIASKEKISLKGFVQDIYAYTSYEDFDFILLDSMFHFGKKEIAKETDFLNNLIEKSAPGTLITICIQNTGEKLDILKSILASKNNLKLENQTEILYTYQDVKSNHSSVTKYTMISSMKTNG